MEIGKEDYNIDKGCELFCERIRRKDLIIDDLDKKLKEKNRKIKDYKVIKKKILEISQKYESFQDIFELLSDKINPLYLYIQDNVKDIEGIKSVYLIKKEDIQDVWFIIKKYDFSLEKKISEFFCQMVKDFHNLYFDILILNQNQFNSQKIKSEELKLVFNR